LEGSTTLAVEEPEDGEGSAIAIFFLGIKREVVVCDPWYSGWRMLCVR
jgi:hypothetical protein